MTKRIFAAVIAIAMVCTMFAFASSAAETTTVNLDSSVTAHGWNQILNAINFNDFDKNEDGWGQVAEAQNLRAILLYGTTLDGWTVNTEEPWNSVLYLKCKVVDLINAGIAWNGETPAADVLVCDYMQNTFGYVAYALRGGKQRALDLWNTYFPGQEATLVGDTAFTYYNNTKYTDDSFNAALNALSAYMTYAQDNQVCNVGTAGRWTAQKARYAALETALQGLVEGTPDTPVLPPETPTDPTLVDMTGLTSPDYTTQLLINFYNNVDVESYRAKEVVQTWAAALKAGVEAGLAYDAILVDGTNVCDLWEQTIRYEVLLNMGARTAADAVMNDASLWPLGAVITDQAQTTYKAAQYQEVYDLWVQIRDEYKANLDTKTSEVVAACDTLKAKIQALEVATLPFTSEQKQAAMAIFDKNYSAYGPAIGMSALEIYQQRLNRVVLDVNKATDTYINYKALVDTAASWANLDWVNGTSESYPTLAEIQALLTFDAEGWIVGGTLEDDWYPFRLAFGLDNAGYDAVIAAAVAEWEASGLYTDASLAAVKESIANFEVSAMTGARGSSNTDELTQGDVAIYKSMLEEKPALPEFKVKTVSLSLSDSIAIHFKVEASVYEAYENVYAMISCDGDVQRVEGVLGSDGRYWFSYRNLTPNMAKVPVEMTLYGTGNGQAYTKTVSYSIYKYCQSLYKNSDDSVKTFIVDFLNYAAALQEYTNYNVDDLANVGFDQSYASATLTAPVNQFNGRVTTIDNPTVAWKGIGIAIKDVINTRVKFQADDITGLSIRFTINGTDYNVTEFTPVEGTENQYYAYFGKTLPNEMRTAFTFTAYRNGVAVSNTAQYSIQSYAAQVGIDTNTTLGKVLDAMLKYGDSCAVAFG